MTSGFHRHLLPAFVFLVVCGRVPAARSEAPERPVIVWGLLWAPQTSSTVIPRDIVVVYLDGSVLECEGRTLKKDSLASFVSGAAKQRKARHVYLFFTPDTRLGLLTEILDELRKSAVSQITINGEPIAAGFRFRG